MRKILVVDNNPVFLRLMVNFLEKKLGHEVVTAPNGLEAIDVLENFLPEIIFVDLIMPKIAGEKLCRIIRSTPRLKDCFIVIVTGLDPDEITNPKTYGADALIIKSPFKEMESHILTVFEEAEKRTGELTKEILGSDNLCNKSQISGELLQLKKHSDLILNNVDNGILELFDDNRIIYANQKALVLLDSSEELVLGSDFLQHFQGDSQDQLRNILENIKHEPVTIDSDNYLLINQRYCTASLIPFWNENGWSIIVILRDITVQKHIQTERAKIEEKFRQAEKMASVGTLAGGIAHEFNNVLTTMIGYTDLSKDLAPEGSQTKDYLDNVLKAGFHAKDLVKQILTFSRAGEDELIPIQIHQVVDGTIKFLLTTTPDSIEIRQHICTDCKRVLANSTMIHQLLINLYTNAVQAMNGKGVLKISLKEIVYTGEDKTLLPSLMPGKYLKLTISDNGPGIEPTIKNRIFDPFFTTKEVGQGSGMGLSVVHGIVEKFGGLITVTNGPGQGASFHVYFPVITDREKQGYNEENQGPILTGDERILFVDDEMMLAHMGKQMLEKLGYKISARTSSVEALEAFRAQPEKFDLIITDEAMPNITGDELAHNILEIRPDIPIILCSEYSSPTSADKAGEIGIRAVVMKPIDKLVLTNTIRQVLDGKKLI